MEWTRLKRTVGRVVAVDGTYKPQGVTERIEDRSSSESVSVNVLCICICIRHKAYFIYYVCDEK